MIKFVLKTVSISFGVSLVLGTCVFLYHYTPMLLEDYEYYQSEKERESLNGKIKGINTPEDIYKMFGNKVRKQRSDILGLHHEYSVCFEYNCKNWSFDSAGRMISSGGGIIYKKPIDRIEAYPLTPIPDFNTEELKLIKNLYPRMSQKFLDPNGFSVIGISRENDVSRLRVTTRSHLRLYNVRINGVLEFPPLISDHSPNPVSFLYNHKTDSLICNGNMGECISE